MSNNRRRLRGARLIPPSLRRTAEGLARSGESGRAIPGIDHVQTQRKAIAIEGAPSIPPVAGRTEISTYFTQAGGDFLLYEADTWIRMNLTLLDAGPVAVGTREQISPVLSGRGGLLSTDMPFVFDVKKGERLFITSNTVNRVRVLIQPVPYGDQVLSIIGSLLTLGRNGR